MSFLAPQALWGLLAIPALGLVYSCLMWRRHRTRRTEFSVIDSSGNRMSGGWRRHLPATLFLVALAALLVSFARPEASIILPVRTGRIMLAFDTSNSMAAADVSPSRLALAREIALRFVDRQPSSVQIGVVAFTDGGLVVQPPTGDQRDIRGAIERLSTNGGTSIGEGIFAALTALADGPLELDAASVPDIASLDIGHYENAAIIVFTDGEDLGGADPVALADLATRSGVPVYTVGVGTPRGAVVALDGFSIATALDEAMLAEIAESTGGDYHLAVDDPELTAIFDEIDSRFERQREHIEVTALFSIAAMGVIVAAAGLSLRWLGRI